MIKTKQATNMQTVADQLGISKSTVSRALSGQSTVSDAMRKRIFSACEELGYQLNHSVQDLITKGRSGITRNIAYILVDRNFADPAYSRNLDGIAKTLKESNFHLHLVRLEGTERNIFDFPPLLRDKRIDGMLISGLLNKEIISAIDKLDIEYVILGMFSKAVSRNAPIVQIDMEYCCYEAAEKISKHGLKRVAYFDESHENFYDLAFFECFKYALLENGIPFDSSLFYCGNGLFSGAYDCMKKVFLQEGELPFDSIVCWDNRTAREIEELIIGYYGLREKPEIVIITCAPYKEKFNVPAITIDVAPESTAATAAQLLVDILQKKTSKNNDKSKLNNISIQRNGMIMMSKHINK
ncbi:MAG: LacI family DNA-binding transcriptional regulator [Lentisphaeria bacterium]